MSFWSNSPNEYYLPFAGRIIQNIMEPAITNSSSKHGFEITELLGELSRYDEQQDTYGVDLYDDITQTLSAEKIKSLIKETFKQLAENTKEFNDRSTLTMAIEYNDQIYIGQAGDSTAIAFNTKNHKMLTPSHNVKTISDEKREEIETVGGNFSFNGEYLYDEKSQQGIAYYRGMGKPLPGYSHNPEILRYNAAEFEYLLLSSDGGIPDGISANYPSKLLSKNQDLSDFSENLVKHAFVCWPPTESITRKELKEQLKANKLSSKTAAYAKKILSKKSNRDTILIPQHPDNITVLVAKILPKNDTTLRLSFIADGAGGKATSTYIKNNLLEIFRKQMSPFIPTKTENTDTTKNIADNNTNTEEESEIPTMEHIENPQENVADEEIDTEWQQFCKEAKIHLENLPLPPNYDRKIINVEGIPNISNAIIKIKKLASSLNTDSNPNQLHNLYWKTDDLYKYLYKKLYQKQTNTTREKLKKIQNQDLSWIQKYIKALCETDILDTTIEKLASNIHNNLSVNHNKEIKDFYEKEGKLFINLLAKFLPTTIRKIKDYKYTEEKLAHISTIKSTLEISVYFYCLTKTNDNYSISDLCNDRKKELNNKISMLKNKMLSLLEKDIDYKEFFKEFRTVRENIYTICNELNKELSNNANDDKEMIRGLNGLKETFQQYWQHCSVNDKDDDDSDDDEGTFNIKHLI